MIREQARSARLFGTHFHRQEAGGFIYTLSRATVPKECLPEHIHDDGQIILAIDPGYMSRAFARDMHGSGSNLIYNPPGTVHRDCFFEVGGRFLSITVPVELAPPAVDPVEVGNGRAQAVASRLVGLCLDRTSDPAMTENLTLELLGNVLPGTRSSSSPSWLNRALELIAARATQPSITIAAIADELGLHPVYFARAYRAALGRRPAGDLQRRRLASAIAMLSRDRDLAEVAASCGFADQSHLSRTLRASFATSPAALREAFEPQRLQMFKTGCSQSV